MRITPKNINRFTLLKLPSAWFTGVRCKEITNERCLVTVQHRWINQNPFNSMYFAVQSMAAELSTGALVMKSIKESGANVSMLVLNNKSHFSKKARGRIIFTCSDGLAIKKAIDQALASGESQTLWMISKGIDEAGDQVSHFEFEWTVKKKR
jgi:hypothetical protein